MNLHLVRSAIARGLSLIGGLALLGLLAVTLLPLLDLTARPVLSGSMEPSIATGALLVTKAVDDPQALAVGDVVTFAVGDGFITHRIVDTSVPGAPSQVVTRGDASDTSDDPVSRSRIVGVAVWDVPYLGRMLLGLQGGSGFLAIVLTPLLLIGAGAALKPRSRRTDSNDEHVLVGT